MMLRRILTALAAALALVSCTDMSTYEQFVRTSNAPDGVYAFTMELSEDSSYDMVICTRDDAVAFSESALQVLRLDLEWVAPSGKSWQETVYMRSGGQKGNAVTYREDSVPSETGEWKLYIKPSAVSGTFRGIGFICTTEDGTRQTP
ncbi:MAG: hypothetical protein IJU27_07050 [Bacteroidales bacterium]|nr:hypothetical protein [Bacteroidales bacterium]